jgi:hypothetical protein
MFGLLKGGTDEPGWGKTTLTTPIVAFDNGCFDLGGEDKVDIDEQL